MAKVETPPNGVDTFMNSLVEASRGSQAQAVEAWARGCDPKLATSPPWPRPGVQRASSPSEPSR